MIGGARAPRGLKQREELAFAARQVPNIEINGTFHSSSYAARHHETPAGFVFAVKGHARQTWARKIRAWQRGMNPGDAALLAPPSSRRAAGRDGFVYFDHDVKVRPPTMP